MVTKIMEWTSITALLMVVSWRPLSYQIPLDLEVCAGAVMGVLSFNHFIKHRIGTQYGVDCRSDLRAQVTASL